MAPPLLPSRELHYTKLGTLLERVKRGQRFVPLSAAVVAADIGASPLPSPSKPQRPKARPPRDSGWRARVALAVGDDGRVAVQLKPYVVHVAGARRGQPIVTAADAARAGAGSAAGAADGAEAAAAAPAAASGAEGPAGGPANRAEGAAEQETAEAEAVGPAAPAEETPDAKAAAWADSEDGAVQGADASAPPQPPAEPEAPVEPASKHAPLEGAEADEPAEPVIEAEARSDLDSTHVPLGGAEADEPVTEAEASTQPASSNALPEVAKAGDLAGFPTKTEARVGSKHALLEGAEPGAPAAPEALAHAADDSKGEQLGSGGAAAAAHDMGVDVMAGSHSGAALPGVPAREAAEGGEARAHAEDSAGASELQEPMDGSVAAAAPAAPGSAADAASSGHKEALAGALAAFDTAAAAAAPCEAAAPGAGSEAEAAAADVHAPAEHAHAAAGLGLEPPAAVAAEATATDNAHAPTKTAVEPELQELHAPAAPMHSVMPVTLAPAPAHVNAPAGDKAGALAPVAAAEQPPASGDEGVKNPGRTSKGLLVSNAGAVAEEVLEGMAHKQEPGAGAQGAAGAAAETAPAAKSGAAAAEAGGPGEGEAAERAHKAAGSGGGMFGRLKAFTSSVTRALQPDAAGADAAAPAAPEPKEGPPAEPDPEEASQAEMQPTHAPHAGGPMAAEQAEHELASAEPPAEALSAPDEPAPGEDHAEVVRALVARVMHSAAAAHHG